MNLAEKLSITSACAQRAVQEKTLDYVSFAISGDRINAAIYTRDDVSDDQNRAKAFLAADPGWRFLVEEDLLLFATTKDAPELAYSYEYKLKYLPPQTPSFERLVQHWTDSVERQAIRYFAEPRTKEGFRNRGVWFVGVEQPLQTPAPTLKIYFKTFFEDEFGERLYTDEAYLRVITDSPIPQFAQIAAPVREYLQFGFHVYMVSWNYDSASGQSKYKIYCIAEGKTDLRFFESVCARFHVGPDDEARLTSFTKELPVSFAGFSLGLTTDGKQSINLYFRGEPS